MGLVNRKPKQEVEQQPVDLSERIEAVRGQIANAQQELRTATADHDQAAVAAVLAGDTLNLAFRDRIESAAAKLKEHEDKLPILFAAQRQQGEIARRLSAEAEEERVADVMVRYRNKLAGLVATNRSLATEQAEADAIWSELPKHPSGFDRILPRVVIPALQTLDPSSTPPYQPLSVINFESALCNMGFADLLEPECTARRRFDHQRAQDERRADEAKQKQDERERVRIAHENKLDREAGGATGGGRSRGRLSLTGSIVG